MAKRQAMTFTPANGYEIASVKVKPAMMRKL